MGRVTAAPTLALVVGAACSTGKPKAIEDAKRPVPVAVADAPVVRPGTKSDVQVRVEWHDVPVAARGSAGRTACGTPRAPAVAPTTTWGIPDAFVALGSDRPLDQAPIVRITLERCALVPRAIVAGRLAIASAADAPAKLVVTRRGEVRDFGKLGLGPARPILLPIAGHEVDVALDPGAIYELAADPATAWIVDGGNVVVTDASGQAMFRDIPAGTYPVVAWLPPRGGQPGRIARGQATAGTGALVEVTVELASP